MGFEDFEDKSPICEINGFPILAFSHEDIEDGVTLSFIIQSETPPTPSEIGSKKLFKETGAHDILIDRGFIDENSKMVGYAMLRRECVQEGPNEFRLNISLISNNKSRTTLN